MKLSFTHQRRMILNRTRNGTMSLSIYQNTNSYYVLLLHRGLAKAPPRSPARNNGTRPEFTTATLSQTQTPTSHHGMATWVPASASTLTSCRSGSLRSIVLRANCSSKAPYLRETTKRLLRATPTSTTSKLARYQHTRSRSRRRLSHTNVPRSRPRTDRAALPRAAPRCCRRRGALREGRGVSD